MGQKMAYLEARLLQHPLGLGVYTPPTTVYFVASLDDFDPTLTGSSVVEPAGASGYDRVSMTNGSALWTAVSGSNPTSTSNLAQVNFPTASADWGTIKAVYVADADPGGNLLYGTAVPGSGIPINNLASFSIPVGAFVIRET